MSRDILLIVLGRANDPDFGKLARLVSTSVEPLGFGTEWAQA